MALSVHTATDERLTSPELVGFVRAALDAHGRAVVLVPSLQQALEVQRSLADAGISLGLTVGTPASWAGERWEVWGDGRRVVDSVSRGLLAARALSRAAGSGELPLEDTPGTAALLAELSRVGLPWFVRGSSPAPKAASEAERSLVALLVELEANLRSCGFVEGCEVMADLPAVLAEGSVVVPPVAFAGFPWLSRAERELLDGLALRCEVALIRPSGETSVRSQRAAELEGLVSSLFGSIERPVAATGAVRLLLPAGPSAEAELVAREVLELVDAGCEDVVVVTGNATRAWDSLAPKLLGRGVSVRAQISCSAGDLEPGRAFLEFARDVARLADLAASWPETVPCPDAPKRGTVRVALADMSWWPPRGISDFLLSQISRMEPGRARALDAEWRGNRLLTPPVLLGQLCSGRVVSPEVAQATTELLRGRLGSAASKLLAPYAQEDAGAPGSQDAVAALTAVLDAARTLKELGITADPEQEGAVSLVELVSLAEEALSHGAVVLRREALAPEGRGRVRILDAGTASRLAPCSADALLLLGQTSVEAAVSERDDARSFILRAWGVEEAPAAMEAERTRFSAIVRVPRRVLVLERTLFGADGNECYPSVMMTEVMACYGLSAEANPEDVVRVFGAVGARGRSEACLSENLSPEGIGQRWEGSEVPAPAGRITEGERELVSPPPEGMMPSEARPILSASQIESYLECPYKWFSLRRLRLRDADAGFTGAEVGTFAHRVLEVSRREMLARAQERLEGGSALEEMRAELPDAMQREAYRELVEQLVGRAQLDPTARVPGSAPGEDEAALEEARAILDEEFDAHLSHQYQLIGGRRPLPQALVPHLTTEHGQLAILKRDLGTLLDFERDVLTGFEPRFFEWGFGRGAAPFVEYAGVLLTGTVDRVDVDAHGQAVVIDYKHKTPRVFAKEYDLRPNGGAAGASPLPRRVQSLIYAQVIRRAFPELKVRAALYLCVKGSHALAGAADENLVDLIFGEKVYRSKRCNNVAVSRDEDFGIEGSGGMEALLDACEEAIAEKMRRLLAGDIEAAPLDAQACEHCPVLNCERRIRA